MPSTADALRIAASATLTPSRFSCSISIFPVIRYAGLTEDKPNQLYETCLSADVVRENQGTALTGLDANHGVRGLAVVATFEESVALWSVENDDP